LKKRLNKQKIPGMKYHSTLVLAILLCCAAFSQHSNSTRPAVSNEFQIIGYVPESTFEDLSKINFERVTQLNYAFANPDTAGSFHATPFLDSLISLAHAKGVKVLISIGGGSPPPHFLNLLSEKGRPLIISSLVQLLTKTKADGIDVDLENDFITENYEAFVTELRAALPPGLHYTAALSTHVGPSVSDKAMKQFDYINIMSYDKTGPWRPDKGGPHASYEMAVDDLNYWKKIRKLKKEKLVLGLPFYGYSFGPAGAGYLSFADIARDFPTAVNQDQLTLPNGNTLYYNGIATIKKKTVLAAKNTSGIMFWQIFQDDNGNNSLLTAIHDALHSHIR
jgi:chitinase